MTQPKTAGTGRERLALPLRAEPDSWTSGHFMNLVDANGKKLAERLTKETAALIVGRLNQYEQVRSASELLMGMYAIWQIDPDKSRNTMSVGFEQLKAALAAGGS